MSLIDTLNWRYACKKFDSGKLVGQKDIEFIQESIRLSASSFGLQLYKVLVIEDRGLREQLKPVSWGQDKVVDASHLFVFCQYSELTNEMLNEYAERRSRIQEKPIGEVLPYINYIRNKTASYDAQTFDAWAAKQCYIALGNLLVACGELHVDACPIEGFEPAAYDRILGLKGKKLKSTVVAAVGYRASDDVNQFLGKVRRTSEDIFIKY